MLDAERAAMVAAARRFATEVVAKMVGTEQRDGALADLDSVLAQAEELGLIASAIPDAPGHSYGVWGADCREQGAAPSLLMLEQIAMACAGVAGCAHFAGLGALALHGASHPTKRAAVAIANELWRRGGDGETAGPVEPAARLSEQDGVWALTGRCGFVHAPPDVEAVVVYGADEQGTRQAVVPMDAAGLTSDELGPRIGLAACRLLDLSFDGVVVQPPHGLDGESAADLIARLWLGLCAIAIGNAEGALQSARRYAGERRQGGRLIADHAAVQLLLGGAEAQIWTTRGSLYHAVSTNPVALRRAAMLKTRVTTECAQAVSDCLQVLGGYGYLEDYRLEKRLRDALTLKSMAGRPNDLLCHIARSAREEAR
jgi:alkylation response protein AidB-like acyl-CoA dehydrogenase